MSSVKNDVIGGFNEFIAEQKKEPGELTITSVQFDSGDPYEVLNDFSTLDKVQLLNEQNYVPRGGTPLNDALGRLIVETGAKLASLKEEDRPEKVIVLVITDGEENSSKEYSTAKIKEMISHQEKQYQWKFIYIGANQDAFAEGGMRGMGTSLNFMTTAGGTKAAFRASSKLSKMMRSQDLNLYSQTVSYADELQKDYEESLKEVQKEEQDEKDAKK
jgi:hypothetical protein